MQFWILDFGFRNWTREEQGAASGARAAPQVFSRASAFVKAAVDSPRSAFRVPRFRLRPFAAAQGYGGQAALTFLALAALAAAGAGCGPQSSDSTPVEQPTAKVEQGPMDVTVKASGEIRAAKSSTLIPKLKRTATLESIVPEGERVKQGQVVARFTAEDLQNEIKNSEAKMVEQQSRLDGAQTTLEIQNMDNEKDFKLALQNVNAAKLDLEKLLQGDLPLDKRNAELKVQTTGRELSMKEKRHKETQSLLADGFVTEYQVEEEDIELEKAKLAAETAKVELQLLEQYTLPLQKTKAENLLSSAETEREKQKKSSAALLRQKTQDVESARRSLEQIKKDLDDKKEQLEFFVVNAPADGVVTYANPDQPWRRSEIQVGAQVHPGQVLMTIPVMTSMVAAVNISESDIRGIAKGQSAVVTVEAASGRAYPGTVEKVAEVANADGWWGSDVKEFLVEVVIKDGEGLKPGFSCNVEISTKHIADAVTVPIQAVFRDDEGFYVYRQEGSAQRKVAVKTGESSETRVQILSGIKPGDTILLTEPRRAREAL